MSNDPHDHRPQEQDPDEELEKVAGIPGAIHRPGAADDPFIADEAAESGIGVGGDHRSATGESSSSS